MHQPICVAMNRNKCVCKRPECLLPPVIDRSWCIDIGSKLDASQVTIVRGEQSPGTADWHMLRCGSLGASRVKIAVTARDSSVKLTLCREACRVLKVQHEINNSAINH